MSKANVFDYGWIDLVFEGRNQKYGAYQLRRESSKTTLIALVSGIALVGILVAVPTIINYFTPSSVTASTDPVLPDAILIDADEIIPAQPVVEPKPTQSAAPAPKNPQPTIRHTAFVATSAPVEKDPPTTDDVLNTDPGQHTDPGSGSRNIAMGPTSPDGTDEGTGTSTSPTTGNSPMHTGMLEKQPEFPGGMSRFYDYVRNNFRTPETDSETTIKVLVSFVIEKDGSLSDIRVIRDPGKGMGAEAIRVLKSLKTKWKAGEKNGQKVRTAYSMPIIVTVH